MKRLLMAIAAVVLCTTTVAQEPPEMKLWTACRNGDVATAREMLDKGVSPNHKYDVGMTPLLAAASRGQTEVVKLLLERGADPNVRDDTFKASPLGMAAFFGHMATLQVLLPRSSSDLDVVLKMGAMAGAAPLVEAGLKGNPSAQDLTVAWMMAKRGKKEEIAAQLEKAGAKPPPALTADDLQRFAGEYRNAEQIELELVIRDGKLLGSGGGGMDTFFEEEFVPIAPNILMRGNPFGAFIFEGSGARFQQVKIVSPGVEQALARVVRR